MRIDLNDIQNGIDAIKKQIQSIGHIINPIINKFNIQDKEKLEVCQIGKFLFQINPELRIEDKPQSPNPDWKFR